MNYSLLSRHAWRFTQQDTWQLTEVVHARHLHSGVIFACVARSCQRYKQHTCCCDELHGAVQAKHGLEGAVNRLIKRRVRRSRQLRAVRWVVQSVTTTVADVVYAIAGGFMGCTRNCDARLHCCCQPTLRCYATDQSGGNMPKQSVHFANVSRQKTPLEPMFSTCPAARHRRPCAFPLPPLLTYRAEMMPGS
jgi:hypothetical protein